MRRDLRERRQRPGIALDGDDAARARREQGPGEAAGAGADLHHRHIREGPGTPGDASGQVEVVEEILP
ncbi:hypothetical protein AEGHOMDF_4211 [Methylobacterium soli]|nr:hypothetical protein AEGHOMDF_4211 [Methylobacterium soli]